MGGRHLIYVLYVIETKGTGPRAWIGRCYYSDFLFVKAKNSFVEAYSTVGKEKKSERE